MTNTDFTARCMAGKALKDVAGKQDVIADLDTIRAGAAAGATAVQPATLEDYQPKIDNTHKLDADLVDDTNSTNKFATQTQLEQIELNKNNISWNTNNGVKNLLNFNAEMMKSVNTGGTWSGNTWSLGNNVTLTINPDKSITLNGTANAGKVVYLVKNLGMAENTYTLSTGELTTKLWAGIIEVGGTENNYTGSTTHVNKTCQPNSITLYIESGCVLSNFTVYPMLALKSLYDADSSYQPYALSNAGLTAETANIIDSTYGTSHNVDLDTLTKGGRYLVNGAESSTSNAPFANWQAVEVYESNLDGYTTLTVQIATELGAGLSRKFRRRTYSGGGQYSAWTAWTS